MTCAYGPYCPWLDLIPCLSPFQFLNMLTKDWLDQLRITLWSRPLAPDIFLPFEHVVPKQGNSKSAWNPHSIWIWTHENNGIQYFPSSNRIQRWPVHAATINTVIGIHYWKYGQDLVRRTERKRLQKYNQNYYLSQNFKLYFLKCLCSHLEIFLFFLFLKQIVQILACSIFVSRQKKVVLLIFLFMNLFWEKKWEKMRLSTFLCLNIHEKSKYNILLRMHNYLLLISLCKINSNFVLFHWKLSEPLRFENNTFSEIKFKMAAM